MLSKIVFVVSCLCALQAFAADSEDSYGVASSSNVVLSRTARGTCGYDSCNAFCRKLGHARGVCIGTYCQCRFQRRRRSLPDVQHVETVNEIPLSPVAANEEGASNYGVSNLGEAVLSRSRRSCGAGECNTHCKKLGHVRGVCIGTYCQCRSQ